MPETPESLRCLSCGFGLAAHATGRCPECGTPVERSLRGDFLANASPDYLARLRYGLVLVIAGTLVGFSWWVATPVLAANARGAGLSMRAVEILTQSIDFASQLLLLLGWWLVSSPNPAVINPEADLVLRRLLRGFVIVLAVLTGIGFVGAFIPALEKAGLGAVTGSIHIGAHTQFTPLFVAGLVIRVVLVFGALGRFVVGLLYLQQLVAKIPDPALELKVRRQVWLFPLLMTLGWLCIGLGPLVGVVLYVLTLVRAQRAIARECRRAVSESVG
ncbi:MAG: hypothetical protein JNM94_04050 [Phycisphaerae bacterium]|nr:hypothetical protein [Phycisphaerae bacterium]